MTSNTYRIQDVCSRFSSGKSIPANEIHEDGNYPVFGGNGLRGYTDKYNFDGECVIIGRQGAYCGNVRYFSGKAYMTEHAIVACATREHDTRFLSYKFALMDLGRYAGQSAQPGLSVETLSAVEIALPPLNLQKKIAKVLSDIDAKIDNNNSICTDLEGMARAKTDFLHTLLLFQTGEAMGHNVWQESSEAPHTYLPEKMLYRNLQFSLPY